MATSPADADLGKRPAHLYEHPDVTKMPAKRELLERNKSERRRLQGLVRAGGEEGARETRRRVRGINGLMNKWHTWLINGGRAYLLFATFILLHIMVIVMGLLHFQIKDTFTKLRKAVGFGFVFARTAALVLHIDVIFILFPVCRNLISLLRQTPLNDIIPFDDNITFHIATAWSIVLFSAIHIISHMYNYTILSMVRAKAFKSNAPVEFLKLNFAMPTGITGWIMTASLAIMVWFAIEKRRRAPNGGFEKFWYWHHLFIVFFICWQLHGIWCLLPPDSGVCDYNVVGVFYRYWLPGGAIYTFERILRFIRTRHMTFVSKVILHPSKVCEVQIKKEKTTVRAGQYIFLNCPEVSEWQWHPFTLTSAPEEDYISVHIRIVGDFTTAFAKALGCELDSKDGNKGEKPKDGTTIVNPPINRTLPRVNVDGPFGSASEDFLNVSKDIWLFQ
ncbi:hypothetical protein FRC18_002869 [Serendipita sp. 400]|nr:hypothetical protein FRC18_002869 [Serendipita sp. 400]